MSQPIRTRPAGCARPLHQEYDTALLDLDGVVYAGGEAIPHAVSSLLAARDEGMRLAYVTNNASRRPLEVVLDTGDAGLRVLVRDPAAKGESGPGDAPLAGMALSLIAALTATFELRRPREGGIEISMSF